MWVEYFHRLSGHIMSREYGPSTFRNSGLTSKYAGTLIYFMLRMVWDIGSRVESTRKSTAQRWTHEIK